MAQSKNAVAGSRNNIALMKKVNEFVAQQKNNTYNYKQVAHAIGATTATQQRNIALLLVEMAFNGEIIEVSPGKYKSPQRGNEATGIFVRRSNGKNSVITDADGETIFVAERNSMRALNGDKVRVSIAAHRRGAEPEAEVVEIIEKKDQTFIGTLKVDKHFAYLLTDSKYLATDIFIPKSRLKGGRTGDKAVVKIVEWKEDCKNPSGEVIDILGRTGENNTEIHAILAEFGLPYKYPSAVEKAADKIDAGITEEVIAQRIDMRDVLTFTIDPADAKDFDDALSFRVLPNGHYEIGVHIADVTHYVQPDTIIDREAQKRATSVYLVDRVVPMLPEHLCNGICSLRPDEEKLAFSVIFHMDDDAKVISSKIARTVIKSNRRFAYEEAQQVIETGLGDCVEAIRKLNELAKIMRRQRYENGSVEFDRAEVKFHIDDDGKPLGVFFKVAKDANKLIEEFMLLANRTVATFVGKPKDKKKPKAFVYRVHDVPDPTRLADLSAIARAFGYKVKASGTPREINRSINKMLSEVKGRGEENYLATLAIRSMAKAVYTTDNIGHYGLGFDYYTHFTSPIRRYPDMMVHRLLERYMAGGRSVNLQKLEDQCKHSSDMEQTATMAERSSIKYKQVEYMQEHIGETYSGIISGVTEWGLYIELNDNLCEGLVPMRDLADDYYDFDEKNHCLVGRRYNHRYRLGDNVDIKVARADLEKKQLDFVLLDDKGQTLRREGEDDLGKKMTVAEALSNNHGKKKRRRR
ncbi:ribonuclease R [uncultured Duncaniella sp.]|jgi:ribonuclease R|uniref:ribonuclease R n=3 Tax=uncultured Duncaniella sp. TaxID=2768039 RepID=UPI000F46D7A3|nr:ribonuclease R [Muribaculaceae bacterium Isolate-080 (Janvier)]